MVTVVVDVDVDVDVVVDDGTVVTGGRAATFGAVEAIVVDPPAAGMVVVAVGATVVVDDGTVVVDGARRATEVEVVAATGGSGAATAGADTGGAGSVWLTSLIGRDPPSGPP